MTEILRLETDLITSKSALSSILDISKMGRHPIDTTDKTPSARTVSSAKYQNPTLYPHINSTYSHSNPLRVEKGDGVVDLHGLKKNVMESLDNSPNNCILPIKTESVFGQSSLPLDTETSAGQSTSSIKNDRVAITDDSMSMWNYYPPLWADKSTSDDRETTGYPSHSSYSDPFEDANLIEETGCSEMETFEFRNTMQNFKENADCMFNQIRNPSPKCTSSQSGAEFNCKMGSSYYELRVNWVVCEEALSASEVEAAAMLLPLLERLTLS